MKTTRTGTASGDNIDVANSAIRDMAQWPSERTLVPPREPTIRDMLNNLTEEQIQRAATHAGRTAPSKRTVRRWKQQGRIPDPRTAELIARHDLINQIGGIDKAMDVLQRSRSALNAWLAGTSNKMRKDARARASDAKALQRLADSGIDPNTQTPRITFVADVMVLMSNEQYDYRRRKDFILGPKAHPSDRVGQDIAKGNHMDRDTILAFAMAVARNDYATVVALLQEYTSLHVADFREFDNSAGFHFEHISKLRVLWL
ncbi:hypothetical protein MUG78_17455 [Gordonia alkaliphila]|uniref:hypothetical protein n=1 Tax=Gordonia alkaliphila TaxID=1053547 RepID=UPI001FF228DB|nr:hypothetical protein [Gordonia alkaliphila]MCK0441188.1 hypothetical protein [Gordonia alkaliphila]